MVGSPDPGIGEPWPVFAAGYEGFGVCDPGPGADPVPDMTVAPSSPAAAFRATLDIPRRHPLD